jgi:hypothetical protein
VSSISGEKLTEWQVTEAFRRCSAELALRFTYFVLAPQWADPPFYRLHVSGTVHEPQRLIDGLDEELSKVNLEYLSKRTSGRLGPITLNHLPEGAFDRVAASATRASQVPTEQYKHRYLYTAPGEDASLGLTVPPSSEGRR